MDILAFQEKFTEALIEAHGDEEEERNGIFYKGNLRSIALCFVEWVWLQKKMYMKKKILK